MNHLTTSTADTTSAALMMSPDKLGALVQFSELMAQSAVTVPNHLRGKPADCLAVCMQAAQWGMNPFSVAQKTHVVNGALGYEAQLVNAVLQSSSAIRGAFSYEYRGDGQNVECRVGAVLAGETELTWGQWLSAATVTTKNSPLWKTNPKQQLGYLQVKNWARAFAPGALLGVYTVDELQDSPLPGGTVHMGNVEEVRPTKKESLPDYSDAAFSQNLPSWTQVIQSGRKTPDQIIAMVQSKAKLSPEQITLIRQAGATDAATGEIGHAEGAATVLDGAHGDEQSI